MFVILDTLRQMREVAIDVMSMMNFATNVHIKEIWECRDSNAKIAYQATD